MSGDGFPSFDEFYAAVNRGRRPFPWQSRLATRVVDEGWPLEIGVQTGLGKTSCIDIAVWSLASQVGLDPRHRSLPTRLWYVVNRRLLVDAAYDHGLVLAGLLTQPKRLLGGADEFGWGGADGRAVEILTIVADGLRRIRGVGGRDDEPLVVSRLRGAAELGVRPAHPAQPTIMFTTVPMFASGWLFRGYASSSRMRSVDAAHAGIDSLVLLDEAHLSRPLRRLVEPLAQCDLGEPSTVVGAERSRTRLVSLTATGDADDPFVLDADDLVHPVVRRRLGASKPTKLVERTGPVSNLANWLRDAVIDLISEREKPSSLVVFTNTAAMAREVLEALRASASKKNSIIADADFVLVTGRMRSREADRIRAVVLDPVRGAPAGAFSEGDRARHLIVIATQTLEVGADLDFDLLVTESCGVRALTQRLGRLNRLGDKVDARAVVVHPRALEGKSWPVYGDEPSVVWQRLWEVSEDDIVDLNPGVIADVLGDPADEPGRLPELLPAHLWEWVKTSAPPQGEAPVGLFFEGFASEGPRVSFCWRASLPAHSERLIPGVSADETVDVPLREAREVLKSRIGSGEHELRRLARDRVTIEVVGIEDVRDGDVVVLGPSDGLYDELGWAPDSSRAVLDVSLERWPGLPLTRATLEHWFDRNDARDVLVELSGRLIDGDEELDPVASAHEALSLASALHVRTELESSWPLVLDELDPILDVVGSTPMLRRRSRGPRLRPTQVIASDAYDDLSADVASISLDDHLASVGEIAHDLAAAIGLPVDLVEAVTAAGAFHDLGKADLRFQLWLAPESVGDELVAKSGMPRWKWRAAREASGWPAGGHHEALSARLVQQWLQNHPDPIWDRDLVLHLVLSHHGGGRPVVAPVTDTTYSKVEVDINGEQVGVTSDLGQTDWDQPARFRRCCERYGYWGLALLETIVRQADHLASAQSGGSVTGVA